VIAFPLKIIKVERQENSSFKKAFKNKVSNRGLPDIQRYAQFDGMLLSPPWADLIFRETYHKLYPLLPMIKSNEDTNKIE
jgi:hypothetical protein